MPWGATAVFFGDERCVPPDDAQSNFRMAREAVLAKVAPREVHRVRGELDAAAAAEQYEREVRAALGVAAGGPEGVPRFDLVLLGLGPDGHTASLFPGTPAVRERDRLVTSVFVAKLASWRVTVTVPVLEAARAILFIVAGADKAEALRAVLCGPLDPDRTPAQLARAKDGETTFLVERAAARLVGEA
jgi:6-phosphogluconolactonase